MSNKAMGLRLVVAFGVTFLAALAACTPQLQNAGLVTHSSAMKNRYFVARDGYHLPYRVWRAEGAPSAVVLGLHGFNDYGKAFAAPASWWAERGITTYAFDQRGFGETEQRGIWPGVATLVCDMHEAVVLLRRRHPHVPLYLLGTSMGAAVVLTAAGAPCAEHGSVPPPEVTGVILAAPAVWGRSAMNPFYRTSLWLGARIMPWNRVSGRGLGIVPSDNLEMLRALGRDRLVIKETRIDAVHGMVNLMDAALAAAPRLRTQALILYGANDKIIRKKPTRLMLVSLRAPGRIAYYPAGYHMLLRDLQASVVWRDILAWIGNPGAPLPSGKEVSLGQLFAAP